MSEKNFIVTFYAEQETGKVRAVDVCAPTPIIALKKALAETPDTMLEDVKTIVVSDYALEEVPYIFESWEAKQFRLDIGKIKLSVDTSE